MNDRLKTNLSLFFFTSAFLLPLAGLLAGWLAIDFQRGLLIGGIAFCFYFIIAGLFLASVKIPTWSTVSLPYFLSIFYTIIPDFFPGPFDDTVVVLVGSLLSFFLWIKKRPDTPRWIIIPLLATTAFVFIGGFIPGPIDELIFTPILGGIALIGAINHYRRSQPYRSPSPSTEEGGDTTAESDFKLDLPQNTEPEIEGTPSHQDVADLPSE